MLPKPIRTLLFALIALSLAFAGCVVDTDDETDDDVDTDIDPGDDDPGDDDPLNDDDNQDEESELESEQNDDFGLE